MDARVLGPIYLDTADLLTVKTIRRGDYYFTVVFGTTLRDSFDNSHSDLVQLKCNSKATQLTFRMQTRKYRINDLMLTKQL